MILRRKKILKNKQKKGCKKFLLLKDYFKLREAVEGELIYLTEVPKNLLIQLGEIINDYDFNFNKTEEYIFKHFLETNQELAIQLEIKPTTVKNYRVRMNAVIEQDIAKDFVKRLLDVNKNIVKNILNKSTKLDENILIQLKQLNNELKIVKYNLTKNLLLDEVRKKTEALLSNKKVKYLEDKVYNILDLTEEISFIQKYNPTAIEKEFNQLDKEKVLYLLGVLNGSIMHPRQRYDLLDLITNIEEQPDIVDFTLLEEVVDEKADVEAEAFETESDVEVFETELDVEAEALEVEALEAKAPLEEVFQGVLTEEPSQAEAPQEITIVEAPQTEAPQTEEFNQEDSPQEAPLEESPQGVLTAEAYLEEAEAAMDWGSSLKQIKDKVNKK